MDISLIRKFDTVNKLVRENNKLYFKYINEYRISIIGKKNIKFDNISSKEKIEVAEHIFFDLLEDFSLGIDYSLTAFNNNHPSIGFTLLRKPVRDLLAAMEFIAIDSNKFVSGIIDNNLKVIDVGSKENRSYIEDEMTDIIKNTRYFPLIDKELLSHLFELRYDASEGNGGLSLFLNQSIHLVTRSKNIKTAKGKLNMLSTSRPDALITGIYYFSLPYFYTYLNFLIIYIFEVAFNKNNQYVLEKTNELIPFNVSYHDCILDLEETARK
ncbi:hypothetical protein ACDI16_04130 [Oceanobacillus caeni]